jgi:hypothetical protein
MRDRSVGLRETRPPASCTETSAAITTNAVTPNAKPRRLVAQLERLGHTVTLQETPLAA